MSEGPSSGIGSVARRLGRRVKSALASSDDHAEPVESAPSPAPSSPTTTGAPKSTSTPKSTRRAESAAKKSQAQAAQARVDELTRRRDELRQKRLEIQQDLGAREGKSVQPRMKVEKTNGVPSFVVCQRMMQRIHGLAVDPAAGLDGIGEVFGDGDATARFARSHAVPVLDGSVAAAQAPVIAHAFKGNVPLVEVRAGESVRHFAADGTDPGDIRPAATHDAEIAQPEGFEDICQWSKVLSRHIPRPYVQVYWSLGPDGPRLHHIDVDPDRIPVLTAEWDKRLGLVFDGAYARFLKQPFRRGGLANRVPGGTFTPEESA